VGRRRGSIQPSYPLTTSVALLVQEHGMVMVARDGLHSEQDNALL
jgi:hypothetical protein